MVTRSREDPLPSSEAEIAQRAREGPSSEVEIAQRPREGPSSEAKIAQRAREGPSSEAEIGHPLEGDANGPHAGLLRVLPFPLNGKQAVGLRGLSRLIR